MKDSESIPAYIMSCATKVSVGSKLSRSQHTFTSFSSSGGK